MLFSPIHAWELRFLPPKFQNLFVTRIYFSLNHDQLLLEVITRHIILISWQVNFLKAFSLHVSVSHSPRSHCNSESDGQVNME